MGARAGRIVLALLVTLGGLLLGAAPALAADPAPAVPYGGQLDAPDPGGFGDENLLEVAMLALGSVNGLAVVGVVVASRFRGRSAQETRRALMSRTGRGVASERWQDAAGRREQERRAARARSAASPVRPGPELRYVPAPGLSPAGPAADPPGVLVRGGRAAARVRMAQPMGLTGR